MHAWQWIKDRPRWIWPVAAILVVLAATVAVAWGGDGDDETTTGAGSTTTERSTTTSTSTTTTSTSTTTTAPPTTTTASPPTTTTAPPAPVPAAAVITARTGAGSGEVEVRWDAVPGATGYRVLRRIGNGSFDTVADFDIATGATTAAEDVVNIWSEGYSYLPVRNPFPGTDHSPWFELVDYRFERERCYQVVVHNPSGDAPTSNTACASPP